MAHTVKNSRALNKYYTFKKYPLLCLHPHPHPEIPIFHILNARITFGNLNGCDEALVSSRTTGSPGSNGPSPGSGRSSISSSSSLGMGGKLGMGGGELEEKRESIGQKSKRNGGRRELGESFAREITPIFLKKRTSQRHSKYLVHLETKCSVIEKECRGKGHV